MQKAVATPHLKALLNSEAKFRMLTGQRGDAIQLIDEQFNIIYTSPSVEQIAGWTPEELEGSTPVERVHPEDIEESLRMVQHLIRHPDEPVRHEYRTRHKNGHYVWIETIGINHLANPHIGAIVGTFRDISKRKAIEEALAESETRLRYMAEAMPQKIYTTDSEGAIEYYNPQWLEYTGLSGKQLKAGTFMSIIHPDDVAGNKKAWERAKKSGRPFSYEHRFRRADGTYRWHLTRAQPVRAADRTVKMWIGSSTDIDDIKQAQKRQERLEQRAAVLREQRRQLLELNRAKDEFISLASHQLRTPATGVKQFLGMILEGFSDEAVPPETTRMIQTAYESNERQLKIVNDLLKVAYVDAGHLKLTKADCDVDELICCVRDELKDVFESRKQTLDYTNSARGIILNADKRLLMMVLENLIDNASKYSPEGKTITVTVQRVAGFLCINIKDEGVGIAPQDQTKLFKKFSRIENPLSTQVGGTGLGLYWAQQVVALHRGTIMVRSAVDRGSTFSVQIPIHRAAH